jgi:hypothetical protein
MRTRLHVEHLPSWTRSAIAAGAIALTLVGNAAAEDPDFALEVRSATFVNDGALPLITISNIPNTNGVNTCTPDGSAGGNESHLSRSLTVAVKAAHSAGSLNDPLSICLIASLSAELTESGPPRYAR